jgi:hypothetical protein
VMEQRFDVRFGSWSCENSSARRALRNISTAWGKESSMLRGMIISIWIDSFEFANHLAVKLSCTTRENASPTARGSSEDHCGRKPASTSRSASGPIDTSTRKIVRCAAMRRRLSRCRWVSDLFALAPSPTANPREEGAAALRHQARHNRAARKSKSQT